VESKPIRAMELLLRHLANANARSQPLAVMMERDTSLFLRREYRRCQLNHSRNVFDFSSELLPVLNSRSA
jgi:hypothetical protein